MDKINNIIIKARYLKKKNWLEAVSVLTDAIDEYPQSVELYLLLAGIYTNNQVYQKSNELYKKALEYCQDTLERDLINFKISNNYSALDDFYQALDYIEKISDPSAEAIYNKAFILTKIDKTDQAIVLLKHLVKNYQTSEIPYLFLSEIYFTRGNFYFAIKYVKIAEKKFGKKGVFHYLKAAAYSHLEKWLQAYPEFTESEKYKLDFPHFLRSFAICADKIGKSEQAITLLKRNIAKEPDDTISYIELIKIYLAQDNIEEAYKTLKEAQSISSFSFPLTLLSQRIIQQLKRKQKRNGQK